ncbi:MAG: caspase family protein [Candidatus Pedobacter colombiensis]|uniref:Caspase family protein n=1 Tax=Candidatus Pedobacter colombiensis TaxID=3121371 RepID=A0AAJ5WB58_9SPHI|nr:caspase family protein [Pedobacter sp.]WEK20426.1 MAG: caspase family protein [Pedobacter sp.]
MDSKKSDTRIAKVNHSVVFQSLEKFDNNSDGDTYLFVVGIDRYEEEERLTYCSKEARHLIRIFSKDYNIKPKNTYSLFNKNATKINIMSHLQNFDKLLDEKDQLVIYFAGHGFHSEYANFFIPADGNRNNFNSNIPSDLLTKIISGFASDTVIMLCDLVLPSAERQHFHIKSEIQEELGILSQLNFNKFSSPERANHVNFINFLSKKEKGRVKQSFYFKKEYDITFNVALSKSLTNSLITYVRKQYEDIYAMIHNQFIVAALLEMKKIVSVNDEDLLGRVESLQYAVTKIKDESVGDQPETRVSTNVEVSELAVEVLNKIDENGFYLVKTPKELADKRVKNQIKILFTAANPRNQDHLRLKNELKAIEYELMRSRLRDDFKLIKVLTTDVRDLQDQLLNESPQFIHFCGHGSCDGIALLNELDNATIVRNKPLAELFKLFSEDIKCIFLNSCHSIEQSKEIGKFIDHIVCMNNSVPDDMAILFATAFYQSIGSGKNIKFSFDFAKNSIDLNGLSGSEIPVLIAN